MDNVSSVAVVNGGEDLLNDVGGVSFAKVLLIGDSFK